MTCTEESPLRLFSGSPIHSTMPPELYSMEDGHSLMQKITKVLFVLSLLVILNPGCGRLSSESKEMIRIKGSDTMLILTRRWAVEFMQQNSGVSVYVEGGGTGTGVAGLIDGNTDICAASRPLRAIEAKEIAQKYRSLGLAVRVAKDALSVYLNPDNPIDNLSLKQIKQIFTGEIINWADVGGEDAWITVIIRPPNSGTHVYFRERILQGVAYSDRSVTLPTTRAIVDTVANNKHAIGYGGIAYGAYVKACRINGIPPTRESIIYDLYPISRYLYLYTIRRPRGSIKRFVDWALSNAGQKIVQETGYIPLWPANE